MNGRLAVLPLILALAGCGGAPTVPAWQQREQFEVLQQCLRINAEDLDDGTTNARSVGVAVARACRPELERFIALAVAGQGAAYAYGFRQEAERGAADRGTELVLRNRSARR